MLESAPSFEWWNYPLFSIHETPISFLSLVTFALTLIVTLIVAKWSRYFVSRLKIFSPAALYGLGRLVYYSVFLLGLYIGLTTIGIDLTGIAVVIGALSVGIGFGLQSVFSNFVAGILVLVEKKIQVGDQIQLDSGEMGTVLEINVRSTLLRISDNRKILIPNTEIASKKVTHWTLNGDSHYRLKIPFILSRSIDKEQAQSQALEMAKQIPHTLTSPAPEIWLTKLTEKEQELELVVWVDMKTKEKASTPFTETYIWALESQFKNALIQTSRPSQSV